MLSKRQIEQRNLRKQSILDGALKVFKTHGIEKTTMDEIAVESGFGKATLYYYFASKDEVFIAMRVSLHSCCSGPVWPLAEPWNVLFLSMLFLAPGVSTEGGPHDAHTTSCQVVEKCCSWTVDYMF